MSDDFSNIETMNVEEIYKKTKRRKVYFRTRFNEEKNIDSDNRLVMNFEAKCKQPYSHYNSNYKTTIAEKREITVSKEHTTTDIINLLKQIHKFTVDLDNGEDFNDYWIITYKSQTGYYYCSNDDVAFPQNGQKIKEFLKINN